MHFSMMLKFQHTDTQDPFNMMFLTLSILYGPDI